MKASILKMHIHLLVMAALLMPCVVIQAETGPEKVSEPHSQPPKADYGFILRSELLIPWGDAGAAISLSKLAQSHPGGVSYSATLVFDVDSSGNFIIYDQHATALKMFDGTGALVWEQKTTKNERGLLRVVDGQIYFIDSNGSGLIGALYDMDGNFIRRKTTNKKPPWCGTPPLPNAHSESLRLESYRALSGVSGRPRKEQMRAVGWQEQVPSDQWKDPVGRPLKVAFYLGGAWSDLSGNTYAMVKNWGEPKVNLVAVKHGVVWGKLELARSFTAAVRHSHLASATVLGPDGKVHVLWHDSAGLKISTFEPLSTTI